MEKIKTSDEFITKAQVVMEAYVNGGREAAGEENIAELLDFCNNNEAEHRKINYFN